MKEKTVASIKQNRISVSAVSVTSYFTYICTVGAVWAVMFIKAFTDLSRRNIMSSVDIKYNPTEKDSAEQHSWLQI